MRYYTLLLIAVILAVTVTAKPAEEKYTTKFDNVNVDNVLKNDRLLNTYVKCLLSKGICTTDGAELRKILPDALKTECSKCTEKQKANTRKILDFLIKDKPTLWADLEKAYDPTGDYKKQFCENAKEENPPVKACAAQM